MFPVVWHVHFFFLSCFVCRSASVGCKALIWFSCSEWELTNHWHCHLLDMSQPSSPHSQHSFHCSTEAQHWWLKASPFWSGEYLHCIFCFHISVLLNFRSSSLLPHILTVLSVFLFFVSQGNKLSMKVLRLVSVTDVQGQPDVWLGVMGWHPAEILQYACAGVSHHL